MVQGFLACRLAAIAFALTALATPARATEFALGDADPATPWQVDSGGLVGRFTDGFSFSVTSGESLMMTSSLSTGFWTVAGLTDVSATLSCDGVVIAEGIVGGMGSPETTIDFPAVPIQAGAYRLQIDGFEQSYVGFDYPMSYRGSISFFDAPAAVAEPAPVLLLSSGLALLAGVRRRRRAG